MSLDNGSSPLMSQPECRRKARAIQEPLEIDSEFVLRTLTTSIA